VGGSIHSAEIRDGLRVAPLVFRSTAAGHRQPALGKGRRVFQLGKAEHHEIISSRRREYVSGVAERRGKYHLTIL
jgi:hypothetical protein